MPLKTIYNLNKTSCSLHCTLHPICYFFNFERESGTCELLEYFAEPLLEVKSGWDFIRTVINTKAVSNFKLVTRTKNQSGLY